MANLPTTNLQPGQSGPNVTNLQQWLIQNGFNIPAGATGYYGAETKAAVAQLQQKLGVNAGNNAGYFGPLTIAAVNSSGAIVDAKGGTSSTPNYTNPQTTQTNQNTQNTPPKTVTQNNPVTPTPTNSGSQKSSSVDLGLQSALKLGLTEAQYNQLDPTQKAVIGTIADVATTTYATSSSGITLDDALKAAQNDPNIIAKYSDSLALDKEQFSQSLQQIQTSISTESQKNQLKFEADRKALAEAQAAAGTAYSGFRGDAQNRLATEENSVVTSSRATLQKNLNDLTSAFESKYGSVATNPATANFLNPLDSSGVDINGLKTNGGQNSENLSGQVNGGITGTQSTAKQNDILTKAEDLYNVGQLPKLVTN